MERFHYILKVHSVLRWKANAVRVSNQRSYLVDLMYAWSALYKDNCVQISVSYLLTYITVIVKSVTVCNTGEHSNFHITGLILKDGVLRHCGSNLLINLS